VRGKLLRKEIFLLGCLVLEAYNISERFKMSAKQKAILWLGIIVFVVMGLFPP